MKLGPAVSALTLFFFFAAGHLTFILYGLTWFLACARNYQVPGRRRSAVPVSSTDATGGGGGGGGGPGADGELGDQDLGRRMCIQDFQVQTKYIFTEIDDAFVGNEPHEGARCVALWLV